MKPPSRAVLAGLLTAGVLFSSYSCGREPEPLRFSVRLEAPADARPGSPVIFQGREIGRVIEVETKSGETIVHLEIDPTHRASLYREALFAVERDARGQAYVSIKDQPGDRTEIGEGDVIDARPGWFERLSRRAGELRDSAEEALEEVESELRAAVKSFEESPEFQAFKERLAEAGSDVATLARERYGRFLEEDLPRLEERAGAYRDKLEREGRETEAKIFWKWFQRWAEAMRAEGGEARTDAETPAPKPEREP